MFGKVFVYVMTVKDAAAAQKYVGDMYAAKVKGKYDGYKRDSDAKITTGAGGRVITVYDLPAFGQSGIDSTQGATVLAWNITGQPYVGIVVTLSANSQSDLDNYWAQNYKPRG